MKREYTTRNTVDMLGCQTILDTMGKLGRELVCTQWVNAEVDGNKIILRVFKRPSE